MTQIYIISYLNEEKTRCRSEYILGFHIFYWIYNRDQYVQYWASSQRDFCFPLNIASWQKKKEQTLYFRYRIKQTKDPIYQNFLIYMPQSGWLAKMLKSRTSPWINIAIKLLPAQSIHKLKDALQYIPLLTRNIFHRN